MTLLLLLRHAPTAWTASRRIQGRADVPLAFESRARLATRRLPARFEPCVCLVSPLRRACETAETLGLAPRTDARLIEMDWGACEGRTLAELRRAFGAAFAANEHRGLDFTPPGGESPRMVQARLAPLWAEIALSSRLTLAVTHRGVIRATYAKAAGWDMVGPPPHKMDDGALQVFSLGADGQPRLAEINVPLAWRDNVDPTTAAPAPCRHGF